MKKRVLSLLILMMLVMSSIVTVCAEEPTAVKANDSNVMMVIDGSGSLTNSGGTDVEGLRYEAIDLFLGLLPNSGNTAGAIVFDDSATMPLDTGLISIEGTESKRVFSDKIRNTQAGGDTDIGSALQAALSDITKNKINSDNPNSILLFSDGETYLPDKSALQKSLSKKEDALKTANKLGIPIHCVCLNTNNSANTSEVKKIAEATNGIYMEINNAGDLSGVFEKFYSLIYGEDGRPEDDTIDSNGVLSKKFQVPSVGVEEVNVVVRTSSNKAQMSLVRPNGIALSDSEMDAISTVGRNYHLLKLVAPEMGVWELQVKGDPNTKVSLNWIYNTEIGADIECSINPDNIPLNSNVEIRGYLLGNGQRVTDEAPYNEYSATLIMTNASTGESTSIAMSKDGSSFKASSTLNEYATYYASLKLVCDKVERASESIVLNVGNTAPAAKQSTVKKKVNLTPFSSGKMEFDLNEYVTDAEDSALIYALGYYSYSNDAVKLDGSSLLINAKDAKSGTVAITATDSQGASCEVNFEVSTRNLTVIFLILLLIILAVVAFVVFMKTTAPRKWVTDLNITCEEFDNDANSFGSPYSQSGFQWKAPLIYWQVMAPDIPVEFYVTKPAKGSKFGGAELVSKKKFAVREGEYGDVKIVSRYQLHPGTDIYFGSVQANADGTMHRGVHVMVEQGYDTMF